MEDKYRVLWLYADSKTEWNCSNWLCHVKSNALNAHPSGKYEGKLLLLASMLNWRDSTVVDVLMQQNILVLERNMVSNEVLDLIRYIQGLGKPVILTWDDAYQHLKHDNPAYPFWIQNKANFDPPPLEMLKRALGIADGFCSPSKLIMEDWREAADGRVHWLPNYAPRGWYENLEVQQGNGDRVVIGWGGSVSHYDSWWGSGIYKAATRVAEKRPEVLFRIHGNDPRIYAHLPVPEKNKQLVPGVPPEKWPAELAQFDIGVAPLHGIYDQRRSWIKGLEYSLAAVPWLGQEGVPYQDLIDVLDDNERTEKAGVLVGEPVAETLEAGADAWEAAILGAIDDLTERKRAAMAAREVALTRWTSEANVESTVALYQKIAAGARGVPPLPDVFYIRWQVPASMAIA